MSEEKRLSNMRKRMARLDLSAAKAEQRVSEIRLEQQNLRVEYQRIVTRGVMEE